MKLLEALTLFPDLSVFSALSLSGQTSKPDGLLVEPYSSLFTNSLFEISESLNVRLNEDLLLGFLLLKHCLNLLYLCAKSVKELRASFNLELLYP